MLSARGCVPPELPALVPRWKGPCLWESGGNATGWQCGPSLSPRAWSPCGPPRTPCDHALPCNGTAFAYTGSKYHTVSCVATPRATAGQQPRTKGGIAPHTDAFVEASAQLSLFGLLSMHAARFRVAADDHQHGLPLQSKLDGGRPGAQLLRAALLRVKAVLRGGRSLHLRRLRRLQSVRPQLRRWASLAEGWRGHAYGRLPSSRTVVHLAACAFGCQLMMQAVVRGHRCALPETLLCR